MKPNGLLLAVALGLTAAMLVAAPVQAQDASTFFRTVSPTTTVITAFSDNGMMTWSNATVGITGLVQRATTLSGESNWVDFAGYTVTGTFMACKIHPYPDYLVVDLSAGQAATNYPVSYLLTVPTGGWTDNYKTEKLVMRLIPAGTFTMGSPTNEVGHNTNEIEHTVTLSKEFYIGIFEVTQRQWELVMGNRPSYFNNSAYYASRPVEYISYYDIRENPGNSSIRPGWPQSSQVHADSFMGKLRAKTGMATFDLPTESQWEYACRAGTGTALNSGKNLANIFQDLNVAEVGRYAYNGGGSGTSQGLGTNAGTATVGSYLPNKWGLYDMHGNVWEWCLDLYELYPGAASDPTGAASGTYRVHRGGGWYNGFAWYCRSACRGYLPSSDFRHGNVGFRVAIPIDP